MIVNGVNVKDEAVLALAGAVNNRVLAHKLMPSWPCSTPRQTQTKPLPTARS